MEICILEEGGPTQFLKDLINSGRYDAVVQKCSPIPDEDVETAEPTEIVGCHLYPHTALIADATRTLLAENKDSLDLAIYEYGEGEKAEGLMFAVHGLTAHDLIHKLRSILEREGPVEIRIETPM